MTESKSEQPWDAVFSRVRVVHNVEYKFEREPAPTTSELDAVETALGFLLPLSYRAFAERFGLGGTIALHGETELFQLFARSENEELPYRRHSVVGTTLKSRDYFADLIHGSAGLRGEFPELCPERLVQFAGGDEYQFMFSPTEVTVARPRECRIYWSSAGSGFDTFVNSFPEWVERVHERWAFGEEEPVAKYPYVFKPYPVGPDAISYWANRETRRGNDLSGAEVAHWLAFNSNAARDLALSIRDHSRTDAFPILADALQDAGCTNADLLDSCRTGDPDIDGSWVLRVLGIVADLV
ncbi:Uncharacterized protein OS=uncultured bacterium PE=4 SV=1 [Gemmata massiliana]|uniref:Knr4/Smi1-like domain-containing protein n=1 Tax=Gemmata massiliana TaxID=1210884 RepID=A0A6P2D721_9BACT|nr:SMI1/KNR4 family protein [Gemmata massiliana]VTR96717.1 Uncharacterized protein OS=uncultured bacterium PE=4 SV=1 [Gemmata massiliana]